MEKKNESEHVCLCPLYGLLDVISKKWALLVIAVLGNEGSMNFNELKRHLKDITSKTLSKTLKDLQDAGLVRREILETRPPQVKYSLTSEGRELRRLLIPLLEWISERGGKRAPWCHIRIHDQDKQ